MAAPGVPSTRSAGTSTSPSVTVARTRLWSSAAIGTTSSASAATTNAPTPSSPAVPGSRATTTISATAGASRTPCFTPRRRYAPAPVGVAVAVTAAGSKLPVASAIASVPAAPV